MNEPKKKLTIDYFKGSLKGHIVAFQLFLAIPYFLIFLILDYVDGRDLSFLAVIRLMLYSMLTGLTAAILIWYGLVRWIKKTYKI